jgi:hypothetical protein
MTRQLYVCWLMLLLLLQTLKVLTSENHPRDGEQQQVTPHLHPGSSFSSCTPSHAALRKRTNS